MTSELLFPSAKLLLVSAGLSLAGATGCGTTIQPGQMGMKYIALDDPALEHDVRPDGFYWQWPWNEIVVYDVTLQSTDETIEVLTEDDLHIPTTMTVSYRPVETELFRLHSEIGPEYYAKAIRPTFMTLVRSEFARHTHNELAKGSPQIESAILEKLRASLDGKPILVDRVSIKHIRFDREVTKSISRKLAVKQKAEQKLFEVEIAKQDADIARATAQGRADSTKIQAEGDAQAIIVNGEAQARAQAAITETLTPSYLQYKAFDGKATRYYFVPVGKDGMPIIVNTESSMARRR